MAASKRSAAARARLRVLVLSGPNLDRLGKREPEIYGKKTLAQIYDELGAFASERGVAVECRQSNHEGALVDWIGTASDDGFAGILLNAGSYTHTSYALYDALKGSPLPAIELHISNPDARESFRHVSTIAPVVKGRVAGFGSKSYELALGGLLALLDAAPRKRTPGR
ncbi:MAG TPA: type II 3-dehydroquinate dehydratase [Polyangiaceae bacterium]|jgi:3-dehydroquinate dehydratase-2|nr:type II 3-dehydroquinate dehydratase [Polyangiaceae bacterium]